MEYSVSVHKEDVEFIILQRMLCENFL